MVREMARVAKRGAVVAALAEGVRDFHSSTDADLQATEKTYGINEHVHTLLDYYMAFVRNKLWVTKMYRAVGHEWFVTEERKKRIARWAAIPLLGDWITTVDLMGFTHEYDGLTVYSRKLW